MIRTQIYLTQQELTAVRALAAAAGKSRREIVREAVDQFIAHVLQRNSIRDAVSGLWRDRDDLPDFCALRHGWDRETRA